MTRLSPLIRALAATSPRRFAIAAALACLVPLSGMALLGLSGWFVAAAAAAGLAGAGLVFDFFRPSALVRLLSFGRAASRYGERIAGHDATLRALVVLRLRLFRGLAALPQGRLARLHSAEALNLLTADIEAAEGVLIRLVFPAIASLVALLTGGAALWLFAGPLVALAVVAAHLAGLALLAGLGGRGMRRAARRQEAALQAIRARGAGTLALRADHLMRGELAARLAAVGAAIDRAEAVRATIDRRERQAATVAALTAALAAALVLALGGGLEAPRLLLAVLVALAMAEAPRLLWRGLAERGRMELAARSLAPLLAAPPPPVARPAPEPQPGPVLRLDRVTVARPGEAAPLFAPVSLALAPGDRLGLSAPSGAGKTTLLNAIAGLTEPLAGQITLLGHPRADWPEAALRDRLALVPQRPALIGGTVADNLALAAPGAAPGAMEAALRAVALWPVLAPRGGLLAPLGEGGAGLSGGESRRLALARAILRAPALLLLDEPTEGLDAATAAEVLDNLAKCLPETAFLIVSHRAEDLQGGGQIVHLRQFAGGL